MRSTRPVGIAIMVATLLALACDDDPQQVVDPCSVNPCSEAALIDELRDIYVGMDADRLAALLHPNFVFEGPSAFSGGTQSWGAAEEALLHQRMFDPEQFADDAHPVPGELWLDGIQVELSAAGAFVELTEWYQSPSNPAGFDSTLFAVTGASYSYSLLPQLPGETDYLLQGLAYFIVVRDRSKDASDSGAFTLYRWADAAAPASASRGGGAQWTGFKQMYREPTVDPCTLTPCSAEAVVTHLAQAYEQRDRERLAALLHPDFLFILQPDPLNPGQPTDWDDTEEARIHHRMFDPQAFTTDPDPVPEELWLTRITIQLQLQGPFLERPEFYASETNPDGLDPGQWKAWGTEYSHSVLFETQGETDYLVNGRSYFVVAQDLTKSHGEPGAFLLYRWQDLGGPVGLREQNNWSSTKAIYR